jgi:hypothetical protein
MQLEPVPDLSSDAAAMNAPRQFMGQRSACNSSEASAVWFKNMYPGLIKSMQDRSCINDMADYPQQEHQRLNLQHRNRILLQDTYAGAANQTSDLCSNLQNATAVGVHIRTTAGAGTHSRSWRYTYLRVHSTIIFVLHDMESTHYWARHAKVWLNGRLNQSTVVRSFLATAACYTFWKLLSITCHFRQEDVHAPAHKWYKCQHEFNPALPSPQPPSRS